MKPVTRFFRENSRTLVLVIMSLLLVVFLIGDVLTGQRSQRPEDDPAFTYELGRLNGRPVTLGQVNQTAMRVNRLAQPFFGQQGAALPVMGRDDAEREIGMYLLIEEARESGIHFGEKQVLEEFGNSPQINQIFTQVMSYNGVSQEAVIQTLGEVFAAHRLFEIYVEAALQDSIPRQEIAYRNFMERAEVKVSIIDAAGLVSALPAPTDAELLAHFEEAKARKDAHTDEALVFGYVIPDRVAVEYLTVDPKQLENTVSVRERDIERHFADNKARYRKPSDVALPTQDGRPQMIDMTLDEARPRIREELRVRKAAEEAQRIVNEIRDLLERPWNSQPPNAAGVRPPPAADQIESLESLAAKFAERAPITWKRTELLDREGIGAETGFGSSSARVSNRDVGVGQLVFTVEGLTRPPGLETLPALRINEPGPVTMTRSRAGPGTPMAPYQPFLFRIVQVSPSAPPAALDAVRDKVAENQKTLVAFTQAGEHAKKLAERARELGLEEAVKQAQDLQQVLAAADAPSPAETQPATKPVEQTYVGKLQPKTIAAFSRRMQPYQELGTMLPQKAADALWSALDAAATQPATQPGTHTVVAAPITNTRSWIVIEFVALKPLYQDEFAQIRPQIAMQGNQMLSQSFQFDWFSVDSIAKRTGFTRKAAAPAAE